MISIRTCFFVFLLENYGKSVSWLQDLRKHLKSDEYTEMKVRALNIYKNFPIWNSIGLMLTTKMGCAWFTICIPLLRKKFTAKQNLLTKSTVLTLRMSGLKLIM